MKISSLPVALLTVLSLSAVGAIGAGAQAFGTGAGVLDVEHAMERDALAHRIAGVWSLDTALTRELGPGPRALLLPKLAFEPNPLAVQLILTANDRTAALDVFGGGVLHVDGATLLYALVDERDGFRLVVFDHANDPAYASPTRYVLAITGEGSANEHLFLGTKRRAESAYARASFPAQD